MDKLRRDLVELIIAIEDDDPKLKEKAIMVKDTFNAQLTYQYGEYRRRASEKKAKIEVAEASE